MLRGWRRRCQEVGAQLLVVPVPLPLAGAEDLLQALDAAAPERVAVLHVSAISSSAALALPTSRLAAWGHARGAVVVVDADSPRTSSSDPRTAGRPSTPSPVAATSTPKPRSGPSSRTTDQPSTSASPNSPTRHHCRLDTTAEPAPVACLVRRPRRPRIPQLPARHSQTNPRLHDCDGLALSRRKRPEDIQPLTCERVYEPLGLVMLSKTEPDEQAELCSFADLSGLSGKRRRDSCSVGAGACFVGTAAWCNGVVNKAALIDVGALFEEDAARILTFAHRLLGNRADAEDVVQETFLKAYRQASGFDGRSKPSTWLFAIARNACLDRLRGRRPRSFDSLELLTARATHQALSPGSRDDTVQRAEQGWYVEAVREGCLLATLSCLSVDQRAAFILRVLCDVSVADTATVLDRSENAVRLLVHRARRGLKGFLCGNCSVYDPVGACRCENLVGFSLSQGWVTPGDRRVSRTEAVSVSTRAAVLIGDVAGLAALYRSLDEPELGSELVSRIRAVLGLSPDVQSGAEAGAET
jgi:RNA polymerase sigma factor (sigma-70 family)